MRQRRTVGAVVRVPLGDGWHTYAHVLEEPELAFYDARTRDELAVDDVVKRPVLFRLWVMNHAVTRGRWEKIGAAAIPAPLAQLQPRFVQDALDPSRFEIVVGGERRPAARDECVGLERAAVWEPEHVEDRLRDHYAGRPNRWNESLRLR